MMANASREQVFKENVGILNEQMAAVAKEIAAGRMGGAAASLEAIGNAAIWISKSLTGSDLLSLPPQMLPASNCRPLVVPSQYKP
jgi:hypothetical protein